MFDLPPTTPEPAAHRLFGLPLLNASTEEALDLAFCGRRRRIAFVNADCANIASRDKRYKAALETADLLLPDGAGVALAGKMQGLSFAENLNGTDLFPHLCRRAAREGKSIFLLGGEPGVAELAATAAQDLAPGLHIAGVRHGFFRVDEADDVVDQINASGADILLVGLGAPRQDVWLANLDGVLAPNIRMGVGGLFDYYSGRIPRAPLAFRRARSEWVWRLLMEPRRLAARYLIGNPVFVARAMSDAVVSKGDAIAKRSLDIVGAACGLIALAPIFFFLILSIRLESRGSAFFIQTRIGKCGAPFRMIKFRSMHIDAETRLSEIRAESDREGVCFKSKTDPRVTRIGRVIRRASVDELPQLFNVLKGDMSLVGPRPALPSEVAAFSSKAHARHAVRPGITGLWQVSGRAEISFDKMIDLDVAYVRARSFALDVVLLFATIRAVVGGRGAH